MVRLVRAQARRNHLFVYALAAVETIALGRPFRSTALLSRLGRPPAADLQSRRP